MAVPKGKKKSGTTTINGVTRLYPGARYEHGSEEETGMEKRQMIQDIGKHYGEERSPKNYEELLALLNKAFVEDNGLRRCAERAVLAFGEIVVEQQGISIGRAARDYLIPARDLSRWANMGLIPIIYKDKGTTYLDKDAVAEAARLYRQAKDQGIQAIRLLRGEKG
jgi:hypothetical protein